MRKAKDVLAEWEEEMREVFEFLEYKPDTKGPEIHLPPPLDDPGLKWRLVVDWYHEGKRYGDKTAFLSWALPDRLHVRRWLTFVLSSTFLPWCKWLGHLKDIFAHAPDQEDFREALIPWMVDPIREWMTILERSADEWEAVPMHLEILEEDLVKLRGWADRLVMAIADTEIQYKDVITRLSKKIKES